VSTQADQLVEMRGEMLLQGGLRLDCLQLKVHLVRVPGLPETPPGLERWPERADGVLTKIVGYGSATASALSRRTTEEAYVVSEAKRRAQDALFNAIADQAETNMKSALRSAEKAALLHELAEAYRLTAGTTAVPNIWTAPNGQPAGDAEHRATPAS
jgi:hypothetical protein